MQQPASGGDPLSRVLELLAGRGLQVRNAANGYMAQCPAHADGSPSLSVKPGEDGRVLLHCFAGCETDAIATALGLQMTDLFPPPSAAGAAGSQATEFYYSILDVEGNEVARHCRRNNGDGTKEMWWCGPDGSKGLHGKKVRDLPLFGTEHLKAAPIDSAAIICEGEKDATALQRRGYLALGTVTGAGGKAAKAPSPDVFAPLRDRDVILWPDNDPIGRQHMILVARHLRGVAKSVRMVEWPDAAEKCGAADFAGTEEQLNAMLDAAKVPAVEPDPANMLILDRSRTMPTAEKFVEEFYDHPDGRTLHYLTGGPVYVDGKRVTGKKTTAMGESKGTENLHLVTYDIVTNAYKDHGAIFYENGERPSYVNSIAIGKDGTVYTLARMTENGRMRTDLVKIPGPFTSR